MVKKHPKQDTPYPSKKLKLDWSIFWDALIMGYVLGICVAVINRWV